MPMEKNNNQLGCGLEPIGKMRTNQMERRFKSRHGGLPQIPTSPILVLTHADEGATDAD